MRAFYGAGDCYQEVTHDLRKVSFNQLFGDPVPNVVKNLKVTLDGNYGPSFMAEIREDFTVTSCQALPKSQIVDIIQYDGQTSMLKLRLAEHWSGVDKFVILDIKNLFLKEINEFSQWQTKISIVSNFDSLMNDLEKICHNNTVILYSHVDEIINASTLLTCRVNCQDMTKPRCLRLQRYYYNCNWKINDYNTSAIVTSWENLKSSELSLLEIREKASELSPVYSAGWNFNYFMTIEEIVGILGHSHTIESVQEMVNSGKDLFYGQNMFIRRTSSNLDIDRLPIHIGILPKIFQRTEPKIPEKKESQLERLSEVHAEKPEQTLTPAKHLSDPHVSYLLQSLTKNASNNIPRLEISKSISISIGVMTCTTLPKYQDEVRNVVNTWYKDSWMNDVPVYFFAGEERNEFVDELDLISDDHIVHLKGIGNDYESASHKQWLGFKYLYDNLKSDFVMIVGTDNYVWSERLFTILEKYDPEQAFLIGGKQQSRNTAGVQYQIFSLGGAGVILTRGAIRKIYNVIDGLHARWKSVCEPNVLCACDLSLAYFAEMYQIVMCRDYGLYSQNYLGDGAWGKVQEGEVLYEKAAVFHYMYEHEMMFYHRYRHVIRYYLALKTVFNYCRNDVEYEIGKSCDEFILVEGMTSDVYISRLLGMVESCRPGLTVDCEKYPMLAPIVENLIF